MSRTRTRKWRETNNAIANHWIGERHYFSPDVLRWRWRVSPVTPSRSQLREMVRTYDDEALAKGYAVQLEMRGFKVLVNLAGLAGVPNEVADMSVKVWPDWPECPEHLRPENMTWP
jgi:hypothetical protein